MRFPAVLRQSLSAVILGLSTICVSAQSGDVGEPIVVGRQLRIRSESMRETRSYQVHLPAEYGNDDARYPVLIVLDGEEQFQHVSATVDFLAAAGKIPATIVIGIPNTDRVRDMDSTAAPGSSAFLSFISGELVPKIDRDYRTYPYRILVGHSDAALFTLYSMINAPEIFRGYIAIAPAFGDDPELPATIAEFLDSHQDPLFNADLFVAADDSTGQPLSKAWELSSFLQERASRVHDLRFTFRRYPEETHSSIALRSVQDGLLNIFDGWEVEDPFALYDLGGLPAIDKHYAAIAARLGFPVAVPEEALLGVFSELEGRKEFSQAKDVIERAMQSFPDSPATRYYAGRLYLQMGDRELAIDALRTSLLLSPSYPAAVSLLEYMKVDPEKLVSEAP